MKVLFFLALVLAFAYSTVYFSETFDNEESFKKNWIVSNAKESEGTQGDFSVTLPKYYGDAAKDMGLKTNTNARFYQASAKFPSFSNKGKTLVVQYSVKHEQNIDCGGAYLKISPAGVDQAGYNGDTKYNIMFGPDICGSTKRTHVIFNNRGTNHLVKRDVRCESDEWSHLYTLIVKPDNTYIVKIDGKEVQSGSLKEDFDMLPPKEIKDPKQSKPADWVDVKMIPDPADVKPADWDSIPAEIVDPEANKPDDWDDELDGEWEAPRIPNPAYKGEWKAKMIDNPEYKGEWVHPMIPNPDYFDDDNLYAFDSFGVVAIEDWQVKAGTFFDNILITDSIETAEEAAAKFENVQAGEKEAFNKEEEAKKAAEPEAAAETEPEADSKDEL